MKQLVAALLVAVAANAAWAQTAPLDLQLPPDPVQPAVESSVDTAGDPPGTYYGDVGGEGRSDSSTMVSGAVSTGIGYSKTYGTATSVGAELNVSRQNSAGRSMDLHIDVSRSSGFPGRVPYYPGPPLRGD